MIEERFLTRHIPINQSKGSILSDMDGEKVMMKIHNGKYYNLGSIGGRIWELLGDSLNVDQLVAALMLEYDVEQQQCEEHVVSFLKHLLGEGLIHFGESVNA